MHLTNSDPGQDFSLSAGEQEMANHHHNRVLYLRQVKSFQHLVQKMLDVLFPLLTEQKHCGFSLKEKPTFLTSQFLQDLIYLHSWMNLPFCLVYCSLDVDINLLIEFSILVPMFCHEGLVSRAEGRKLCFPLDSFTDFTLTSIFIY